LDTPIKFGRIPEGPERDAFVMVETNRRVNAALDLYDIDPGTPEAAKWCALAMYLLGEHFKGCRSLARQPGGAPKNAPSAYSRVVDEFDTYCRTARPGSDTERAGWFLAKKGGTIQIGNEKISTARSLLNMRRRAKKAAS
jgi:hypothetical protein